MNEPYQRTLLAWRRTALSLVAAGLLVAQVGRHQGVLVLAATLVGTAVVVAFLWLGRRRRLAVNALVLALGVVLLGVVALGGVLTG